MKRNTTSLLAICAATALTMSLAGCGSAASSAVSTAESASEPESAETATSESTEQDAYAYLAEWSPSTGIDANGHFSNVNASDYVTLPDGYEHLTLPDEATNVSDDTVSSYIDENILSNYSSSTQVTDRAAASGDTVNIDYVGSVDGVEFSGGNTNGSGTDLVLGSHSYIDDFEDQIVGHTPGETFNVTVTFPTPYSSNPDLAGKEAVFVTTLNYISDSTTPELTDDWVKENLSESLNLSTVKELQEYVRSDLVFTQESNEIYTQLSSSTTFADPLPEALTNYYRDYTLARYYSYALQQGMTLEELMATGGYDSVQAYLDTQSDTLTENVKQTLILQAIAEAQNIECDDEAYKENLDKYFGSNADTYVSQYGENFIRMTLLNDIVMEWLIDGATA